MFIRLGIYLHVMLSLILGIHGLENLALDKMAEMSTQRTADTGADGAVDGNTAQTIDSASCALTALDRAPEAWWRVDLNGTFAISKLRIYLLNTVHFTDDVTNWRSSPYCTKDDSYGNGPSSSVVRLNCDEKGRYLTIWLNKVNDCNPQDGINQCDILQLCEVQVLGCYPGNYSQNCNMTCPVNCRDDICSIDGGLCYECKDGYLGNTCSTECEPGKFGRNCSQVCNCRCRDGETCSHINGYCPNGCMDGYIGMHCNKTCTPGTYGYGCYQTCGHCLENDNCSNYNGTCPRGCQTGRTGVTCKEWCPDGAYGFQCGNICSGNCNTTCNKTTGQCDTRCIGGWEGLYCNKSCNQGTYGPGCIHNCSGNCKGNDSCSIVDGSCPNGCDEGWRADSCHLTCINGKYGFNCNRSCGNCHGNEPCIHTNGTCGKGCASGWQGSYCNAKCCLGRYGVNCSMNCRECEDVCHHITGECFFKDLTTTSIVWPITNSFLCVLVVILLVIVVIQCRRNNVRNKEGFSNIKSSNNDRTSSSGNVVTNYEELQTGVTETRVYDSLDDAHVTYQNTIIQ